MEVIIIVIILSFITFFIISEGGWGCNIVKSDHFAAPSAQLF